MRGEQRGEDGSQFLVICRSSGNSRLAVYFTYHRVSDALEWTQLSQFTFTLPARERSKRIQTILVLAFIKFFCLRAYSCTGILGCALHGTRRRNLRENKSCRHTNQSNILTGGHTYLTGIALKEANFLV